MLLTALETAKAIGAEQCSPMEETEHTLQPAKHTNSLGRAKMLFHTGLPTLIETIHQHNGFKLKVRPSAQTPSPKHMELTSPSSLLPAPQAPICWSTISTPSIWKQRPGMRPKHPTKAEGHRRPLNSRWYMAAALPPKHPPWQAQHIPPDIRPWHCPMRWKKGSGKLAQKVWPGF